MVDLIDCLMITELKTRLQEQREKEQKETADIKAFFRGGLNE